MRQGLNWRGWGCSITSIKIQRKCGAWFSNSFSATRTTFRLVCTVSLAVCKNHAIQHTTFVSMLTDAENMPLSENTVVVYVLYTRISPISIQRYRQLADRGWSLDLNNTSCILYAIQCRELVPHSFDSFWTILQEYVLYRSVRRYCVLLHSQARNLWGNPVYSSLGNSE